MGDIADDMIDGVFDFHTGEYIGPGVGHPRTLDGSLPWEKPKNGRKDAVAGVHIFLDRFAYKTKQTIEKDVLVKAYQGEVLKLPPTAKFSTVCRHIQEDWSQFVKWVNETYKKT